jgi:hypothetical protein
MIAMVVVLINRGRKCLVVSLSCESLETVTSPTSVSAYKHPSDLSLITLTNTLNPLLLICCSYCQEESCLTLQLSIKITSKQSPK